MTSDDCAGDMCTNNKKMARTHSVQLALYSIYRKNVRLSSVCHLTCLPSAVCTAIILEYHSRLLHE